MEMHDAIPQPLESAIQQRCSGILIITIKFVDVCG